MSSLKDGDRVQTPRHGLGTVKYIGSHVSASVPSAERSSHTLFIASKHTLPLPRH